MEEHIISLSEIEVYVSNLEPSKLNELGGLSWFESHKRLHMLYQEALLESINDFGDRIKETFLLHGKIKTLVYEAITLSVWRYNVFPLLSKVIDEKEKIFPIFVQMYHEATAFGLLESLAFHADCVESLQDTAVELLDYCFQNILQVVNRKTPLILHEKISELSPQEELEHHEAQIVHNLAIKSINVLRFIAEAFELLPLSIASRFYNNHDIPMLLCQVIECSPWFTTDLDGKLYHLVDGNWRRRERGDEAVNKSEGQAWLCLRQVVLDQRFLQHYELNDFRSRQLSKLMRHLHDDMLDQLSPLVELKHFLCQLSVANLPTPSARPLILELSAELMRHLHDDMLDQLSPLVELKHFLCQLSVANLPTPSARPLILELSAEFKEKLMRKFSNKWNQLASKQANVIQDMDISAIQTIASGLAEAYLTLDLVEPEPAKCANCGEPAAKRCSRCKAEWYCGRECQVKMWDKHKTFCSVLTKDT